MRHFPFRLVALCVPILLASSGSQLNAQDWLRQAITHEDRAHDFGTVARAAKTEHRFMLHNVLDREIHISSVRASCGCTTPIIENKTIPPGESGAILARFNTGTFTGQRKATLTVTIDRPYFTELQLNVRGYIRSDIVFDPGEVQFGQVAEGENRNLELTLDYAGRGDWAVKKIESPVPFINAQFEELSRGGGRVRYRISVGLDGSAPVGFLQNQLLLFTNDRRLTNVPIRLQASVQPALQFSPQSFTLGRIKPGEPIRQRLVVKGSKPFRILDISSEAVDVQFEPIPDAKAAHLINITMAPNSTQRGEKIKSHLILKTDLKESPLELGLSYELD